MTNKTEKAQKAADYYRAWYAANRERNNAYTKAWRKRNHDKHRIHQNRWKKKKRASDLAWRIKENLRGRISAAIDGRVKKSAKTIALLGCPIDYFIKYIESRFLPGMSWDNYGAWHIDHVIPCDSFDLSIKSQQRACFSYSNMQPLWAKDNYRKRNFVMKQQELPLA